MDMYIIQVYAKRQISIKQKLLIKLSESDEFNVKNIIVPTKDDFYIKNGKKIDTSTPIYPGYIFIECDLTHNLKSLIMSINGVVGFVGGKKPSILSKNEIKSLIANDNTKDIYVGCKVNIVNGPYSGFSGVVSSINNKTCYVDTVIFTQKHNIEIGLDDLVIDKD